MKTSIILKDSIINEAVKLTGIKNRTELIHTAVSEYCRAYKRKKLMELAGSGIIDKSYNVDKHREASNAR